MASLELLSPAGFRKDGRRLTQHRRITAELGSFGLNGGATFTNGKTMVMAQVLEDEQVICSTTQLIVSISWAAFAFPERRLKRQHAHDRLARLYEAAIKRTFEPLFQNKSNAPVAVNLQLTVLCADGGILAACLNATSLALARSGYALEDFVVAVCVAAADGGLTLVDPTHYETLKAECDMTVGCLSRTKEVALMLSECKISTEQADALIGVAIDTCTNVVRPAIVATQERHARRVTLMRTTLSDRLVASS